MNEVFKLLGTIAITGAVQAKKDIGDISDKASGLGTVLNKGITTVGKWGVAIGKAALAGSAAVVAFAKEAVGAGAEFDSSMSQVMATMGYSVDEINTAGSEAAETMQTLRDFAQEMGRTTAFSASEAADALNYMALAGYDAETSMDMLPTVLNLAAAGGIELAAASDMVTDAQTALGLNLDQTRTMVDQMAKTASKSNTSVAQLGEAFLTVGGNAKNLKGGTNELAATLGVLADNGIKSSEAGTHLRNIMLAMTPKSDAAAIAMEKLGFNAYDAQGNLRSMSDIFLELNKSMEGMTQEEKTNTISAIFNKTDLASVNALLATSAERWDELGDAIADSKGSAEAMAGVQLDNLSGDVTLFKSALEGTKIAISDELTPSLRQFVQLGSDGLSRFTEAFQEGGLSSAMEVLGDIISNAIDMVVEMLPDLLDAGTQLVTSLINGIVKTLPKLTKALIASLPKLIKAVKSVCSGIAKALPSLLAEISSALPELIPLLVTTITDGIPMLIDGVKQVVFAIIDALPIFMEAIVNVLPVFMEAICNALPDLIPQLVAGVITMMLYMTEHMMDIIQPLVDSFPDILFALAQALLENLPIFLEAVFNFVGSISAAVYEVLGSLLEPWVDIFKDLWEGIKKVFGVVGSWFSSIFSGAWNGIKSIWKGAGEFFAGIWNGIKNIFGSVGTWFGSIFSGAWNGIKSAWNGVGEFFVGIWNGIKKAFGAVSSWFKDTFSKAWQAVKDVFSAGGKVFDGIKDGIVTVFKTVVNALIKGINKVIAVPFKAINNILKEIHDIEILNLKPFSFVTTFDVPEIPQLAHGGVLKRGQVGFLEGDGDEAVVPLSKNTEWIDKVAEKINGKGSSSDVVKKLDEMIAAITSMKIFLDTGAMVGEMTPALDTSFGNLYAAKERGR